MNRQSCRKTLRNKEPKKTLEVWRSGSFGKRFTDLFLKVVQSIQEYVLWMDAPWGVIRAPSSHMSKTTIYHLCCYCLASSYHFTLEQWTSQRRRLSMKSKTGISLGWTCCVLHLPPTEMTPQKTQAPGLRLANHSRSVMGNPFTPFRKVFHSHWIRDNRYYTM